MSIKRLYKLPRFYACSEDGIDGGFYIANKYAMEYAIQEMSKSGKYYCQDYSNGGHGCVLELEYKDYFEDIGEVEIDNEEIPIIVKFLKNNYLLIKFPFNLDDMMETSSGLRNNPEDIVNIELESSLKCMIDSSKLKSAIKEIVKKYGILAVKERYKLKNENVVDVIYKNIKNKINLDDY